METAPKRKRIYTRRWQLTSGVKEAPSRRREQDARETEWKLSSITLATIDAAFAAINDAAAKRTAARQPRKK